MKSRDKSGHQKRIEDFMRKAGQEVPCEPTIPDPDVRLLRAKLIFEEAMETIFALGVDVMVAPQPQQRDPVALHDGFYELKINENRLPDMIEIADGCADISVVTIGTLSACGIADKSLLKEVDESNLRKFGPGCSKRDDGKWVKPPDWKAPDIAGVLNSQMQKKVSIYEDQPCQQSDTVW
jgi:predicted HAD superfamily Cof-like phosphohydrolase